MKFFKKPLVLVLFIFLGASLAMKLVLASLISPAYLEELLEDNLNCSASVGGVKVRLLARELEVRDLELRAIDAAVDSPAEVEVKRVYLGIRLLPLLGKNLEATSFVIEEPVIRMWWDEEGDLSLAEIFQSREGSGEDGESASGPNGEGRGVLAAEENRWLAKLDETRLEKGRVELMFEKEKLRLDIQNLAITVDDLQFDPEELSTLNQVAMALGADVRLYDRQGELLVQAKLAGEASGELFNAETGDFDADVVADLALGADSYVNPQVKVVRQIWAFVQQVDKVGVEIGDLPSQIEFGRSRRITGSYVDGTVRLVEPLSLSAGKWELGLAGDSWIETYSGRHELGVEFLAGEQVSLVLGGWLESLPAEVRSLTENRFVDREQVLWRVTSTGNLDDPELDFLSQLPEVKGLVDELEQEIDKEVDKLKDKAGQLFRGLLGEDD